MTVAESGFGPDRNSRDLLDLIRSCVAGDESAWAKFYDRYNPKLRLWTLRYNSFPDHIDDILQDSWRNLMADRATVLASYVPRADASFDSWLFVVHRRYCLRWLRREAIQRILLQGDPVEVLDSMAPGACQDLLVRLELRRDVEALPQREQEILSLSLAGYSHDEIGRRYSLTATNIGVILYRIRSRLKALWTGAM